MARQRHGSNLLNRDTILANRYVLERVIGIGGMATVYSAFDEHRDGAPVALKVLHPALAGNEDYLKRFVREVKLLSQIEHPNIVEVYDIHCEHGLVFYSMELFEGNTLEEFFYDYMFDTCFATHIALEICKGLKAIHEAGVIHRDIKPANILVANDGSVKIADFGTARGTTSSITQDGETLGSVCYIAPEAWNNEEPAFALDYYSFGVILYELLTGDVPFDGGSPMEVMRKHLSNQAKHPKIKNWRVPRWLASTTLRLLARDPEQRLTSADEVIYTLENGLRRSTTMTYVRVLESIGLG